MTSRLLLWLALFGSSAPMPASPASPASPADPAPDSASRLFEAGNRAARKQRWNEALSLWAAAEAASPSWQPAFNQASVLSFRGRALEAWQACERTRRAGVPPERTAEVDRACEAIAAPLRNSHAELSLQVEPADAQVTLGSLPWVPPWHTLVKRGASELTVEREGYSPVTLTWTHPLGQHSQQVVHLAPTVPSSALPIVPASGPPTLPASGPPASASPPIVLPVAPVAASSNEFGAAPVGATRELVAAPVGATQEPVAAPSGPHAAWKYVAWTLGGASAAAGGLSLDAAEDLRTPRVFRAQAAEAEQDFTARRDLGLGLVAVGAVGLAVGFVLWWWEGP